MRILILLLLASCAFGQHSENSAISEWSKIVRDKNRQQDSLLADIEKRLKALEDCPKISLELPKPVSPYPFMPSVTVVPSCSLKSILFDDTAAHSPKHGRFYEDLRDGYPDKPNCSHVWKCDESNVVEIYHGWPYSFSPNMMFECKKCGICCSSGQYPFCPPHDWCWGDTTLKYFVGVPCPENRPGCCVSHFGWVTEDKLIVDWQKGCESRFECPAICRVCLTDTLAVWSYAEDQQRRAAAKKLTEYEMLMERKRGTR